MSSATKVLRHPQLVAEVGNAHEFSSFMHSGALLLIEKPSMLVFGQSPLLVCVTLDKKRMACLIGCSLIWSILMQGGLGEHEDRLNGELAI